VNHLKTAAEQTPPVQLARHLGLFEATMLGVGAMIGAGIFVLTGIAVGNAGPAALIAFGLNGVITLFTALSYAELSSAIPEAGGGYSFIKKVMPNSVAFASGWMLWFAYIVACSLYAKGFGSYFMEFTVRYIPAIGKTLLGVLGQRGSVVFMTIVVSLLFISVNIIGTHASGKTENIITLAKIAILAVFIFFGLKQALSATAMVQTNFKPLFPMGFTGVLAAMGLAFIAFEGYDLIATVSEEVREPRKTIPKAILYSLAITVTIYLLVVFVCIGAVAPAEGLPTWQLLGKYKEIGIIRAAQSFMPAFGIVLVLGGGLFATLSALNATVLASSRVAFSMGRDWMLPHSLSRIHSQKRTPVLAISISGFLFIGIAIFLPLESIGVASSLLFLLTFSLVNLALIIYRKRSKTLPPFRIPLFPLFPVLGFLTSVGLGLFQLIHQGTAWMLTAAWIGVGLVIYFSAFSRKVKIADVPKYVQAPELLDLKKTRRYKILVPLANPARVLPLMYLASRIAKSCKGEILSLNVSVLPNITEYSEAEPFLPEAQFIMNKAQKIAFKLQVPHSFLMKIGRSVASEIIQVAKENGCQLILLGYKKDEDPLENSVIHRVINRQPCDIAILKSDADEIPSFRNILLPIGGQEIHDHLKARIVHCLSQEEENEVTFLKVYSKDLGRATSRKAEESLKRTAAMYNIPRAKIEVKEHAHVAEAIAEISSRHDFLILGMRKGAWLKSFFFGMIAQQITGQVRCPTLLTKTKPKSGLGFRKSSKTLRDDSCPVDLAKP
jgi:amino acid transporter/nucleotide-binding universal stress UspA family protein